MKVVLTIFLSSYFFIANSQSFEALSYEYSDSNYVVERIDSLDKKYEVVYYKGQLISECELINSLGYYIPHGKKTTWYETGEIKTVENYSHGGISGEFRKFYKDGSLEREDYYSYGKLTKGKCYDKKGKEIEYCDYYSPLEFPGKSRESYLQIIQKKMRYPREARKKKEEGIVFTSVLISKTGLIEEVEILNSFSESIDEEVFRVLFDLPKFTPLKIEGKPINARVILPFNFVINNKEK